MRSQIIAGNWKMNCNVDETTQLVNAVKTRSGEFPSQVTVVICPPFTSLGITSELLKDSRIKLGAQNISEHDSGAYTGEISWSMIRSTGCSYVILGHSERRQYFLETNELINRKAKKALANSLTPIICVGETLDQREKGITEQVITTQIAGVLEGISSGAMARIVLAYEPVWAIGTGRNASPSQAEEVHRHIRVLLAKQFGKAVADDVTIQYGGSVKPENALDLLSQPDIDGALVGGACLKADSFAAIIRAAKK